MPRTSKQVKKAMERAERAVRREAEEPQKKKKRRTRTPEEREQAQSGTLRWVADTWGMQGEVLYFQGKYWGVFQQNDRLITRCWTEKEWEERKLKEPKTQLQRSETSETGRPLSSTQRATMSTKPSRRPPNGKSPTKPVLTHLLRQERWR